MENTTRRGFWFWYRTPGRWFYELKHFFSKGVFERADAEYYRKSIGHQFLTSTFIYAIPVIFWAVFVRQQGVPTHDTSRTLNTAAIVVPESTKDHEKRKTTAPETTDTNPTQQDAEASSPSRNASNEESNSGVTAKSNDADKAIPLEWKPVAYRQDVSFFVSANSKKTQAGQVVWERAEYSPFLSSDGGDIASSVEEDLFNCNVESKKVMTLRQIAFAGKNLTGRPQTFAGSGIWKDVKPNSVDAALYDDACEGGS